MATWDSADLLQRVRDLIGYPSTHPVFTNDFVYRKLTEAEQEWKPVIAVMAPQEMWVGPYLTKSLSGEDKLFGFADVVYVDTTVGTGWSEGSGWSAGVATAATSDLSYTPPNIPIFEGLTYRVRATVVVTSGSVTPKVGGTSGTAISASASLDEEIVAGSDGLGTFTGAAFTGSVTGVSIELAENPARVAFFESLTGQPLDAGDFTDPSADYVLEEGQIRVTGGRSRSYTDGAPYVRMIPPAGVITASVESTIKPKRARILLVYKAAALCGYRVGTAIDPSEFEDLMDEAWNGNPESGKIGLAAQLRTADYYGASAGLSNPNRPYAYWRPNG